MTGTYYSNPKTLKQGLNQLFKGKLSSNTSRLTSQSRGDSRNGIRGAATDAMADEAHAVVLANLQ